MCLTSKPVAAFPRDGKWWAARCRDCQTTTRRRSRDWYRAHKASLACERCGLQDHRVLDFHHRDRAQKSYAISTMVSRGMPQEQVLEEMRKCDVMCSNCHRIVEWEYRCDSAAA